MQPLVSLNSAGSSDPDDLSTLLTFKWTVDGLSVCEGNHISCGAIETHIDFGTHLITLRVTDPHGAFDEITKTVILDSAFLSLLDITRARVEFTSVPPSIELIGDISLPIAVNYTELAMEAAAAIDLAGVGILASTPVTFTSTVLNPEEWLYSSTATTGITQYDIDWNGAGYHFIEDGYPIELKSHLITSGETILSFRFDPTAIGAPFNLSIGGIILSVDASGVVSTLAPDANLVVEEAGREVVVNLPFPLLETTEISITGNPGVNRNIPVAPHMTASTGRFRIRANFNDTLLPNGANTLMPSIDLMMSVGIQDYPGAASILETELDIKNNEWRK